jgi:hypothetical protein
MIFDILLNIGKSVWEYFTWLLYRLNKVDVSQWFIYCVVITIGDIALQDVQLFFGNSALL